MTMRAKRYQNSRRFHMIMRRTTPLNPLNLLNPPNLFQTESKGSTPKGLTPNPAPYTPSSLSMLQ